MLQSSTVYGPDLANWSAFLQVESNLSQPAKIFLDMKYEWTIMGMQTELSPYNAATTHLLAHIQCMYVSKCSPSLEQQEFLS